MLIGDFIQHSVCIWREVNNHSDYASDNFIKNLWELK